MLFRQAENFHNKSIFYSSCKKSWAVENSIPIIEKLHIINTRKMAEERSLAFSLSQYPKIY